MPRSPAVLLPYRPRLLLVHAKGAVTEPAHRECRDVFVLNKMCTNTLATGPCAQRMWRRSVVGLPPYHYWNEDPMYGCKIGTTCPILHAKYVQLGPHFISVKHSASFLGLASRSSIDAACSCNMRMAVHFLVLQALVSPLVLGPPWFFGEQVHFTPPLPCPEHSGFTAATFHFSHRKTHCQQARLFYAEDSAGGGEGQLRVAIDFLKVRVWAATPEQCARQAHGGDEKGAIVCLSAPFPCTTGRLCILPPFPRSAQMFYPSASGPQPTTSEKQKPVANAANVFLSI
jgi:hypothetical protein